MQIEITEEQQKVLISILNGITIKVSEYPVIADLLKAISQPKENDK